MGCTQSCAGNEALAYNDNKSQQSSLGKGGGHKFFGITRRRPKSFASVTQGDKEAKRLADGQLVNNILICEPSDVHKCHLDSDEDLEKIMLCFPFAVGRPSPKLHPPRKALSERRHNNNASSPTDGTLLTVQADPTGSNGEKRHFSVSRKPLASTVNGSGANEPLGLTAPRTRSFDALQALAWGTIEVSVPAVAVNWLRERLKKFTQLTGHQGALVPATDKTLWKRRVGTDAHESCAYEQLMTDVASPCVARFFREVNFRNDFFIEIEDLCSHFTDPAMMDVKMGTRTFLESEVSNPTKRTDLYDKMVAVEPDAPTEEEKAEKAITKLRYLQFRDCESSTAALGFRIEAVKPFGDNELWKDFKKVRTRSDVGATLTRFIGNRKYVREQLVARLQAMRQLIEQSPFFHSHEIIGSSLFILYDNKHAGAWMIDFAKTTPVPEGITLNHRCPWELGNHEDGYLFGLTNLIEILEEQPCIDTPVVSSSL